MKFVMDDNEWSQYRNCADRVSVAVIPVEDQTRADDPSEYWLLQSTGAAWDQDWLVRRAYEITMAASSGNDNAPAPHWIEVHEKRYSWGADSAAYEVLLYLVQWAATSVAWDALKLLAAAMQKRLANTRSTGDEPFPLDDEEIERVATRTLSARYGHELTATLELCRIDVLPPSSASVAFTSASGWLFECDIVIVGESVTVARVRREAIGDGG